MYLAHLTGLADDAQTDERLVHEVIRNGVNNLYRPGKLA